MSSLSLFVLAATAAAGTTLAVSPHALESRETWGNRAVVTDPQLGSVVVIDRSVRNATVEGLQVDGAYRVIENNEKGASAKDIRIVNVHATNVRRGLVRMRNASNGTITDSSVRFSSTPQSPPHLPIGLHFQDQAHDWIIRNVTVQGAQMVMGPKRYWNGDGIATERETSGFRFINVTANDNTDAGFDLKGSDTFLDNVSASGNARNYRFWTSMRAGTLTSGDTIRRGGIGPTAGIWIKGSAATPPVIEIEHLIVNRTKPGSIFLVQDGAAEIRVKRCDLHVPEGTRLVNADRKSKVTTQFGPGCTLPK